jgi:hypothetical protein
VPSRDQRLSPAVRKDNLHFPARVVGAPTDTPIVLEGLRWVSERPMIIRMTNRSRPQRRYDHRLRDLVQRTGDLTIATDLGVPRSTARGWLGTAPRVVVSLEGSPESDHRSSIDRGLADLNGENSPADVQNVRQRARLGVRDAFCCRGFPLASPLPSTPSAAGPVASPERARSGRTRDSRYRADHADGPTGCRRVLAKDTHVRPTRTSPPMAACASH